MDPPRLRSDPGTLGGRILRSAPSIEPTHSAEDALWRRLQVATAVGVAAGALGATSAGAHVAATAAPEIAANVGAKALWVSLAKWGVVLAVAVPAAGATTYAVVEHRNATREKPAVVAATHPTPSAAAPAEAVPSNAASDPPIVVASPQVAVPHAGHGAHRLEATSALRAESALLSDARSKLAANDFRGALDDVARSTTRFPHGRLVQEREVVAIDALAALGRSAAMRARAQAFLERFPESPYAAHVRQNLEP